MPSAAELRAELKALRKDSEDHKPISRMKKGDISSQIERLRASREETAASAAVSSAKSRQLHSSVESLKKAKESEFPVRPQAAKAAKVATPKRAASPAPKKRMTKAEMMRMLEEMSSDDD